jgi:hypothetical protein
MIIKLSVEGQNNIAINIGLKGSLIFSELERRFFEATHKKSSDLEKIKFGSEKPARFRSPLSPVQRVFSKRKPRFSATVGEAENRRVKFKPDQKK